MTTYIRQGQGLNPQPLTDNAKYAGSNSHQITINSVDASDNNALFLCLLSMNDCIDTSRAALLRIDNTLSLNQPLLRPVLRAYPNPVNQLLYIEIDELRERIQVELTDINGKLVKRWWLENGHHELDVQNLTPGIYVLTAAHERIRLVKH
ncbi:MAG: T9SS type A sorting domain-containing protein [Bacteroidia bacterium]